MKNQWHDRILLLFLFLILLLLGYHKSGLIIKQKFFCEDPNDKKISIFIFAGQSNMVGRGGVVHQVWNKVVPPECNTDPRILRINKYSQLEVAKEPLHDGIDAINKTCGVGPGMAFANAVLRKVPNFGTIILVPSAVGGTSIRNWSDPKSIVRRKMIERTKEAVRYGGKVRGILWYQGETDTESEEHMRLFPGAFEKFISILYQELNHPKAPFIQVALASGAGWLEKVRATQLGMKDVITVDGMGLELQTDHMHLTTMAQVRLGTLMADAFLNFTQLT